ncbi:bifunctional riboflavin kinase/FAD synthetase [Magnetovibrio sp. PR-2]|uniref:bifunctional riboflavin kinase/FAD synthetase n=1 Tax=Magnetovibrio sp. PR-2 TaxID=3120356 RepID=UPI002FCE2B68
MRIFRHYTDLPEDARGSVVAIGNFDGIHKGHQVVINEAGSIARATNVPWAVMSFEPHPDALFKPDGAPFRLSTMRTKAHMIEQLGVDELLVQHFDFAFAGLTAQQFVEDVLVGGLGATHVVAGYDFQFGQKRSGDCDTLLHMGRELGFGFTAVPKVADEDGIVYSSTRVREYLIAGDPRGAAHVLGRPAELEGRVEKGDQRGRQLGFPTANLDLSDFLRPALGVYAIRAGVDEGLETQWINGVCNVGKRPTFKDGEDVLLEAHLFDFEGDLYGKHLRVQLIERLRPEQKFAGLDAIKAQIAIDCEKAREILSKEG